MGVGWGGLGAATACCTSPLAGSTCSWIPCIPGPGACQQAAHTHTHTLHTHTLHTITHHKPHPVCRALRPPTPCSEGSFIQDPAFASIVPPPTVQIYPVRALPQLPRRAAPDQHPPHGLGAARSQGGPGLRQTGRQPPRNITELAGGGPGPQCRWRRLLTRAPSHALVPCVQCPGGGCASLVGYFSGLLPPANAIGIVGLGTTGDTAAPDSDSITCSSGVALGVDTARWNATFALPDVGQRVVVGCGIPVNCPPPPSPPSPPPPSPPPPSPPPPSPPPPSPPPPSPPPPSPPPPSPPPPSPPPPSPPPSPKPPSPRPPPSPKPPRPPPSPKPPKPPSPRPPSPRPPPSPKPPKPPSPRPPRPPPPSPKPSPPPPKPRPPSPAPPRPPIPTLNASGWGDPHFRVSASPGSRQCSAPTGNARCAAPPPRTGSPTCTARHTLGGGSGS